MQACSWVGTDPIYIDYHDNEWGKVEKESRKLFEQLCLEGQQAGLSWITVLKKRENYRQAFFHFDPYAIAQMNEQDINRLMQNTGLIRHRAKLEAIIKNAKAYLAMMEAGEDFSHFLWHFVDYQPCIHDIPTLESIPSGSPVARQLAKALKKKGFVFVGETTCYAFMQAVGMVDDHHNACECKTKIE